MNATGPQIGATRIKRVDAHNVAVERYSAITNTKTKETRYDWQEVGYYGHRIDHAAESALFTAMPEGEKITPQMIRDAVAQIVEETGTLLRGEWREVEK